MPSHLRSPQRGDTPLEPAQQSQLVSRLDRIKHQLLTTRDWAAVAVAKPLEVTFTQTEEIEKFGKRRKLTEADWKRLADAENNVSWIERPFCRGVDGRDTSSEMETIKGLNIRINGRDVRAESLPEVSSSLQTNASSQPMLLGQSSVYSRKSETTRISDPQNVQGSHFDQGPEALITSNPPPFFPIPLQYSVDTRPMSWNWSPNVVEKASVDEGAHIFEQRPSSTTQTGNSADECQLSLNRRRFTIDDQIDQMIAENERRLNAANRVSRSTHGPSQERQERLYHDAILSPKTVRRLECYPHRTAHHEEENLWLSGADSNYQGLDPFHNINQALQKSAYQEKIGISSFFKTHKTDIPLSSTGTLDAHTSPTKIFGQPVVLDGNDTRGTMQSIWNQGPKTSFAGSSARILDAEEMVATQSQSPAMRTDANVRNLIIARTQRPNHNHDGTFLSDDLRSHFILR